MDFDVWVMQSSVLLIMTPTVSLNIMTLDVRIGCILDKDKGKSAEPHDQGCLLVHTAL